MLPGDPLSRLLDRLLASAGAPERDRALVDAALASGAARAAALWRPARGADDPGADGWRAAAEGGATALLPSAQEVREVAGGRRPGELPLERAVLVSREPAGGAALALGGVADEDSLDRLDALFRVWAAVAAADDAPAPPLRSASDASMELRALLDAADAERVVFARGGLRLAVETRGDLLRRPPALGERRLFHLVRSLLAEARAAAERGATVRFSCAASDGAGGSGGTGEAGWELAGSIESPERGPFDEPVFRMWLPAARG